MSRHEPAEMTRRDRAKAAPSFTPLARADQASAWSRTALYGGGTTLAALILALGFTTLRPGSRRREPEIPAAAWAETRHRR